MFVLIFFSVFLRLGGFLLNVTVGSIFGSGAESDVYFFVCQTLIYGFFYASSMKILTPVIVPLFIQQLNEKGEAAAWDFANTVLNLVVLITGAMALAGIIAARPIVDTLAGGFEPQRVQLAVTVLRLALPGAVGLVLSFVLFSLLNSYKIFSYPGAAEAAQKLVWVACVILLSKILKLGLPGAAVGLLIGCCVQVVIAMAGLRNKLTLYRPGLPLVRAKRLGIELFWASAAAGVFFIFLAIIRSSFAGRPQLRKFEHLSIMLAAVPCVCLWGLWLWKRAGNKQSVMARFAALMAPLVIGTALARLRDFTTYYFQSYTPEGVYSDILFAKKVGDLPTLMVAYTLGVAMFPFLCEMAVKKDRQAFADILTKTLLMLALGFIPVTIGTILLAQPVVELVYDRGNWEPFHVAQTATALQIYVLGLVCYAAEHVLMQSFFSMQRMWWPSVVGVIATVIHFVILAVPILLLKYDAPMEIFLPVALSYPLSRMAKEIILLFVLRAKIPILPFKSTVIFTARLGVSCVLMTVAVIMVERFVSPRIPIAEHRRWKVQLDNAEPAPASWFSRNAISQHAAIEDGQRMVKLSFRKRAGRTWVIERDLKNLRLPPIKSIQLTWRSPETRNLDVSVNLVDSSGRRIQTARDEELLILTGPTEGAGVFTPISPIKTATGAIIELSWTGEEAADSKNEFEFDIIECVINGEDDEMEIDPPDWDYRGECAIAAIEEQPGILIASEQGNPFAELDVESHDLSGSTMLRFKAASPESAASSLKVELLTADGKSFQNDAALIKNVWTQFDLPLSSFKLADAVADKMSVDPSKISEIRFSLTGDSANLAQNLALTSISFYRPGDVLYEVLKVIRIAIASGVGAMVFFISIFALRTPEALEIVVWIRNRGWKMRGEIKKRAKGSGGESPNASASGAMGEP